MPVREVALDRDVRAQRLLPVRGSRSRRDAVRRAGGVLTLVIVDLGAMALALVLWSLVGDVPALALWPGLSATAVGCWGALIVVCAAFAGLYGRLYVRHVPRRIVRSWVTAFLLASVTMIAIDNEGLGARMVAVWILAALLSLVGRWAFDALVALRYGRSGEYPPALLLGEASACLRALHALEGLPPHSRVSVVGLVVPDAQHGGVPLGGRPASERVSPPPVVGSLETLPETLAAAPASQIIVADPASLNGQMRTVMDACRASGMALKVVDAGLAARAHEVAYIPGLDCPVYVVQPRPAGWSSYLTKRLGDRAGAAALLILLSPLFLAIAVAVKLGSRGPVFFVDDRVGLGQRTFRFYKFRTMVAGAHESQAGLEGRNEADGVLFKIRDDPRLTGVGRLLRRFSLDELPQLANVLKGDMSLVGPRALPVRDCERMDERQRRRHVVLPGITGLWQVSGRSDLGFDAMLELDLRYIETWSLRTDLYVLWHTPGAVLRSRGAY